MSERGKSILEKALGETITSSMLCACVRCGSSATYRGSPPEINRAAKEFYELHKQCWERQVKQR